MCVPVRALLSPLVVIIPGMPRIVVVQADGVHDHPAPISAPRAGRRETCLLGPHSRLAARLRGSQSRDHLGHGGRGQDTARHVAALEKDARPVVVQEPVEVGVGLVGPRQAVECGRAAAVVAPRHGAQYHTIGTEIIIGTLLAVHPHLVGRDGLRATVAPVQRHGISWDKECLAGAGAFLLHRDDDGLSSRLSYIPTP